MALPGIQILPERILDQKRSTIVLLLRRSRGKQIDDLLDGFVGAVIRGFQFTGRLMTGDRAVVETAVCERTAKSFLITHKPQPVSGADRALVWFGQRPT